MTISVQTQCEIASSTFKGMERISSDVKSRLLHRMADNLISHSKNILAANQIDIRNGKANGLSAALLDRLSYLRHVFQIFQAAFAASQTCLIRLGIYCPTGRCHPVFIFRKYGYRLVLLA